MSYRATITVETLDDAAHTARFTSKATSARPRRRHRDGRLEGNGADGETHVALHTDAQISGIVATVGGRLIEAVAQKTIAAFAANLAKLV